MTQAPVSPPTAPAVRTKWPTVIGIITMILGIMAAVQGCAGVAMQPLLGLMLENFEEMGQNTPGLESTLAQFRVLNDYRVQTMIVSAIGVVVAIVLIMAASALLRRRRRAAMLCRLWAILKIIVALVGAVYVYGMMGDQFAAMEEAQRSSGVPGPPAGMYATMAKMAPIFSLMNLIWFCALPVFLLIWFNRETIRKEVSTWSA